MMRCQSWTSSMPRPSQPSFAPTPVKTAEPSHTLVSSGRPAHHSCGFAAIFVKLSQNLNVRGSNTKVEAASYRWGSLTSRYCTPCVEYIRRRLQLSLVITRNAQCSSFVTSAVMRRIITCHRNYPTAEAWHSLVYLRSCAVQAPCSRTHNYHATAAAYLTLSPPPCFQPCGRCWVGVLCFPQCAVRHQRRHKKRRRRHEMLVQRRLGPRQARAAAVQCQARTRLSIPMRQGHTLTFLWPQRQTRVLVRARQLQRGHKAQCARGSLC